MISLRENLSVALTSILANKLRSVLTMLGIIIGVGAVITIVSIGSGMGKQMNDQLNNEGFANIEITAKQKQGSERLDDHPIVINKELLTEVYTKYADQCEGISVSKDLSEEQDSSNYYVKTKKASKQVGFVAINSGYWKSKKRKILYGSQITNKEFNNGSHVIIISESTAKSLFGKADETCIGKTVDTYFSNTYATFTVKGIFEKMNEYDVVFMSDPVSGSVSGVPYAFFPLSAYQKLTGANTDFSTATIIPKTEGGGKAIISLVESIKADMEAGSDDYVEYQITTMLDFINQQTAYINQQIMTTALIAAIALLVGGIGVMNIMMVSIMERTREIGTRKALGATNASLLSQFITEAILLCLIGGIIGIVVGIIGGIIGCNVSKLPYVLNVLSIIVALFFSVLIGAFFGYYPASKAARMDPIDALRYE